MLAIEMRPEEEPSWSKTLPPSHHIFLKLINTFDQTVSENFNLAQWPEVQKTNRDDNCDENQNEKNYENCGKNDKLLKKNCSYDDKYYSVVSNTISTLY